MKFVCDNCKAKYQIGDDKVAGKTLRMKCRRCGHMIQVAATVTESSVSQKLPAEPAAGSIPALEGSSPEDGATIVRQSPLFLFQENKAAPAAPARPIPPPPAASVPGAPPRPGAGTGNIPRPISIGASNIGASNIGAGGMGIGGSPRIVPPARASLRGSNPPPAAVPLHSPSSPGLYSGFQAAVAAPVISQPASAPGAAPLPTEDWYVGVGGVPLGPVRLAVVREKAANGQVDQDSLVWREGFDEWLPIKSFPALLAVVDEVKQQRISRTSSPTPSPPIGFTPMAPAVLAAQGSAAPAAHNPFAAPKTGPSAAGSLAAAARALAASAPSVPGAPVRPLAGLAAQGIAPPAGSQQNAGSNIGIPEALASVPFDLMRGSSPSLTPFAVKDPFAPAFAANGQNGAQMNGALANGSAGHLAPPEAASTALAYGLTTTAAVSGATLSDRGGTSAALRTDTVPPSEVFGRKKKGVHPMVWAFVAMAAAFGGVAAWALFLRKPDIVYVPKDGEPTAVLAGAAAPPPPPTGTGAEAGSTETAAPGASESGTAIAGGGTARTGGPLPTAPLKPGETAAPIDTSGFGTGGPGPSTAETSGTGKGSLNSSQLNGVVSSNSPRVRKKCWDPLVSSRSADAPSSVKVTATVKIGPSGSVKSVTASGGNEKHYPGLAGCVQQVVSTWTFPASDEGGTVVVPFGFNAQ